MVTEFKPLITLTNERQLDVWFTYFQLNIFSFFQKFDFSL